MEVKNWHTKLKNWHVFRSLSRLLACWHVKKRSWHAFGTLARGHGDHAGTHGTRGTQTALIYETYLINIGPI